MRRRPQPRLVCLIALAAAVTGCGLQVSSPDLFVLRRVGPGRPLTLLVNDGATIRCDNGPAKTLPDPLLIDARQISQDLDADVKLGLRFARPASSVYSFTVRLPSGTLSFPDTAAAAHSELARAEAFALEAEHGPCGRSG